MDDVVAKRKERHELFDELEAFDPRWQQHYRTTREAVLAAGERAVELFRDWAAGDGKGSVACQSVPDTIAAVERLQRAAASTSLPFRLNTIGRLPARREFDEETGDNVN